MRPEGVVRDDPLQFHPLAVVALVPVAKLCLRPGVVRVDGVAELDDARVILVPKGPDDDGADTRFHVTTPQNRRLAFPVRYRARY